MGIRRPVLCFTCVCDFAGTSTWGSLQRLGLGRLEWSFRGLGERGQVNSVAVVLGLCQVCRVIEYTQSIH